jgi:low molecular weight phosphotyrosine protein phosphatase
MTKINILMVCLGNICRSPLAEGVLKSMLDKEHFMIDSAGTASYHIGGKPDERSIIIARENGVDISKLRARTFTEEDFEKFDYIFVMDKNNYIDVLSLSNSQEHKEKVFFLLDKLNTPMEMKELPDPYYGDEKDFISTYLAIKEACEVISSKLKI